MEFFIDKLLPEHTLYFVEYIMSLHGDVEHIMLVNDGKSAFVKYSNIDYKLKKLVLHLEVMRSVCFYYNDETADYWILSLADKEQPILVEELTKLKKENELLKEKLDLKQEQIEELEKMLVKLREEHNTAIIMLKDMSKLLK